ncbi:hypothetical protein TrispH2_003007 [Trichoplax sp. H2]|nr:hypothetical protein TrispH2_003007 [Trichoplax sp. H2]|eukprot:RDD45097.1 hypothetical protein TrispH2_003007 [Trichoplax sp. H2]
MMIKKIPAIAKFHLSLCIFLAYLCNSNAVLCGFGYQPRYKLWQRCDCKWDCPNKYDELRCVDKIIDCPLWGPNGTLSSVLSKAPERNSIEVPCLKQCQCSDLRMNCNRGFLYKMFNRVILPYSTILFEINEFKIFPIDTVISQPWIRSMQVTILVKIYYI